MPPLSPTNSNQQRPPPPSLFLGPPSRDASHVSLPTIPATGPQISSVNAPALASQRPSRPTRLPSSRAEAPLEPAPAAAPIPKPSQVADSLPQQQQQQADGKRQADRIDALWAEMQQTLGEVEISAETGTHVFGAEHSRALEDLRTAQIALAQAWARSEADEAVDAAEKNPKVVQGVGLLGSEKPAKVADDAVEDEAAADGKVTDKDAAKKKDEEKDRGDSKLEEETEKDIQMARKRREANDRYFQRVNGGVLDVVAKLEEVATAMKGVERESRSMWSDSSSGIPSSS
ncbi:MAG: hypothetical protein M1825_000827 [Sarcosagium campestre]|nr:MAG: hypothetical protein M1825_000827 [Sarcosagium campestre]